MVHSHNKFQIFFSFLFFFLKEKECEGRCDEGRGAPLWLWNFNNDNESSALGKNRYKNGGPKKRKNKKQNKNQEKLGNVLKSDQGYHGGIRRWNLAPQTCTRLTHSTLNGNQRSSKTMQLCRYGDILKKKPFTFFFFSSSASHFPFNLTCFFEAGGDLWWVMMSFFKSWVPLSSSWDVLSSRL